MNNAVSDMSTLTNIPEKIMEKLLQTISYIICEAVVEDDAEDKEISSIDLVFGILHVKHSADGVKFKFVPSNQLENAINASLTKKLNLMENALNNRLSAKLLEVYKELC